MEMNDVLHHFQNAMGTSGLVCSELLIPNTPTFQRFGMDGDKDKPCWYILTVCPNGFAVGSYGCFKRDIKGFWCSKSDSELSMEDKRQIEAQRKQMEEQHKAQQKEYWDEGVRKAKSIWDCSDPANDNHSYLQKKQVKSFGLRMSSSGDLIVPVHDHNGELHGLQFISSDGSKRFLPGTSKKEHFYKIPGNDSVIFIAEGYATAVTVHQATGNTVVVAFDAGNLLSVAQVLRRQYSKQEIIIAADNDQLSSPNVGLQKAREAAEAINAQVVYPKFQNIDSKQTDFNDLMVLEGIETVSAQIDQADYVTNKEALFNNYRVEADGVFYFPPEKDGVSQKKILVCSALEITARTRNENNLNHGRLLEFKDDDGVLHRWAIPMEMLATDGAEYRRVLLNMGLNIPANRKARELLTDYIQSSKPKKTALCTDHIGWHNNIFVFPDKTFGSSEKEIYLQTTMGFLEGFEVSGTLDEWKENIGKLCEGNSRLIFSVSLAFAAPLLYLLKEESGGFHFRGASSSGKTTALKAACSVYGAPTRLQRWRATSNGLEGIAKLHNDGLLCLDELAQVDPNEAGAVAYMLANGVGKIRSKQDGTPRQKVSWRILFLSAAEISLSDHMQSIGKRVKAGQEVRLIDLPSDAGNGFGIFENLHDFKSGDAFARHLIQVMSQYYGTPIRCFLEQISVNQDELISTLRECINDFIKENVPLNADGQINRALTRFALVAAAGELASQLGITGWKEGDAIEAAKKCFDSWVFSRGGHESQEKIEALQQVRTFFQLHSESRFSAWDDQSKSTGTTINKAGFKKLTEDSVEFFVETEVFKKEICKGLDNRFVTKVCKEAGWLLPDGEGKATKAIRMPDTGKTRRVYHFTYLVLGDDHAQ